MLQKLIWAWFFAIGIGLLIIGSLLLFNEVLGLVVMAMGGALMLISAIILIILLIKERSRDNEQMREDIDEEDLRP